VRCIAKVTVSSPSAEARPRLACPALDKKLDRNHEAETQKNPGVPWPVAESLTLPSPFASARRPAASNGCIYSRRNAAWPLKESDTGTNISGLLHFNCRSRRCVSRAVTDTESDHIAHSAAGGPIECDRKDRLQQAPSHSRNRIPRRRGLSRCAGHGV